MNRVPRRIIRVSLLALCALVVTATAATAGMLEERLSATRTEAKAAKQELRVLDARERNLQRQVSRLNRRIAELERPLRELELGVEQLEYRIARREERIRDLRVQRERQRTEIIRLERELQDAQQQLAERVVVAYKAGDTGMIEQLAAAGDLGDLFRREEALAQVVGLDDRVIDRIADAERSMRLKRARNVQIRIDIREDIDGLERERAEIDARRATAQAARDEVAAMKAERDATIADLNEREQAIGENLESLEQDATTLKQVIATGQTNYVGQLGGVSASGLIWPVSGPVVSPFGPRWGRMHEGIDIAIAAGNPIYAAAAGVVTHAGPMGGYGNMVIVQHAGGLSTGYAHQSQIASSAGQLVTQGQLIGYIGCTGHCYGDHLHFETRVNGEAVDPYSYL